MSTKTTQTFEIEVYDIQSSPEESLDPKDQARIKELQEELGLEGLAQILDKEGIIPYRRLTTGEYIMFSSAFPYNHKPEDFKQIIPLRILEIFKDCKDKGYFESYQILHTHDVDKDPILLARTDKSTYSDDGWYIVARWGSSLISEIEIAKMAKENLQKRIISAANKKIAELKTVLDNVDDCINKYLDTGNKYKSDLSDISF